MGKVEEVNDPFELSSLPIPGDLLPAGPQFEDVVRHIPMPRTGTIDIPEEAAQQTATLRRIANTLVEMQEWRIMHERRIQYGVDEVHNQLHRIAGWTAGGVLAICAIHALIAVVLLVR